MTNLRSDVDRSVLMWLQQEGHCSATIKLFNFPSTVFSVSLSKPLIKCAMFNDHFLPVTVSKMSLHKVKRKTLMGNAHEYSYECLFSEMDSMSETKNSYVVSG